MKEIVGLRVRLRAKNQEAEEKKTKKSKQRRAEKGSSQYNDGRCILL